MRGLVRDRVPVGLGGYVQAYARMMLAYLALFVPLVVAGQSSASTDEPILHVSDARETAVSVLVLLAKLALEVVLVLVFTARTGGLTVFGRPVVVRRTAG